MPHQTVTAVENRILGLVREGVSSEEVASRLDVSIREVGGALHSIAHRPQTPASGLEAIQRLSPREWDVLALVAQGQPNKKIQRVLEISQSSVKHNVESVLAKMGAASRTEAAVTFAKWCHRVDVA